MSGLAFYNDNNPYCCTWLESLISDRIIPYGIVECCSIKRLDPTRLARYTQVHLFAGMGGWPYALRLAGWPDDRPIWTGSCPCQPFSVAGRGKGRRDKRHLWPDMYRLIRLGRPACIMGEQVAGAAGYDWFDGVRANLEKENYEARAVDIPACGVGAPHIRQRLYWVAHARRASISRRGNTKNVVGATREIEEVEKEREWDGYTIGDGRSVSGFAGLEKSASSRRQKARSNALQSQLEESERRSGNGADGLGHIHQTRSQRRVIHFGEYACELFIRETSVDGGGLEYATLDGWGEGRPQHEVWRGREPIANSGSAHAGFWDDYVLVGPDPDGMYRRVKPGIRLLADGVPNRISKLGALGNSIVPQLAEQVIRAYMDIYRRPKQSQKSPASHLHHMTN